MRNIAAMSMLSLIGAAPPPSVDARLRAIIAPVSQEQLHHTIATLVSFGTRHTLSSQTDPKRGIGAGIIAQPRINFLGQLPPIPQGFSGIAALDAAIEIVPVIEHT